MQIIEVIEPEAYIYHTLNQRCKDITKYECNLTI